MNQAIYTKLAKAGLVFVIILSLFFVVLTINKIRESKYIGAGDFPSSTITVSGEGEAFAIPDVATFTFGIQEEADTFSDAQEAAAERANEVIAFLRGEGVEEEDIKTVVYNGNPRYEFRQEFVECFRAPCPPLPSERVLVGFEITQRFSVKVRDTERAGEFVSGVGALNVDTISSVNFSVDDEDAVRAEARELAIEDAQEKAEELADDLGVRLVRVVSFFEEGRPRALYAQEEALPFGVGGDTAVRTAPELPVGESRVVSNVSITYEIR